MSPTLLELFYAEPALDSVAAAEVAIRRDRLLPPKGHLLGRFRSFQGGMVENCPDLSADDPRADRPDNAWPLGLPAVFPVSVYSFHANAGLLAQGLRGLIAESAALHELHLFDPAAGLLYRPDRVVIDRAGGRHAPPPPVLPALARSALIKSSEVAEVIAPLRGRFAARIATEGFVPREQAQHGWIRTRGAIRQNLWLAAQDSHGAIALHGHYKLFAPAVTAVWAAALPDAYSRFMQYFEKPHGGMPDGFNVSCDELDPAAGQPYGRYVYAIVRTREPLARWFQAFGDHVLAHDVPRLDAITTPQALADLLLTDRLRWRLETKNDVRLVEAFGLIVLAHAFRPAEAQYWSERLRAAGARSLNYGGQGFDQPYVLMDQLRAYLHTQPLALG